MAVRHHSYAFSPAAYLEAVRRSCLVGGALQPEAMRAQAEAVVRGASGSSRDLLDFLRYDEEQWLPPRDAPPAWREWLMLLLVPHLEPRVSLSQREPHGYFVLDRVLPALGWPRPEVDLLIRGESLDSLPARMGIPMPAELFHGLGTSGGGWIPAESFPRLRLALEQVRPRFLRPGEQERQALAGWLEQQSRSPQEVLTGAFLDAVEMLGDEAEPRARFQLFE